MGVGSRGGVVDGRWVREQRPGTRARIEEAGFAVAEIGNSECAKLDGGMSCLSLRFTPS